MIRSELAAVKADKAKLEQKVARLNRRTTQYWDQTMQGTPLPGATPPMVSSLTDPAIARYHTPQVRTSFGRQLMDTVEEVADSDEEEKEKVVLNEEDEKEAAKLAKVMTKMAPPERFTGETDKQKEHVEEWVRHATTYMNGQFGSYNSAKYASKRIDFIKSYLSGAAHDWLVAATSSNPTLTWERLSEMFILFIKGGRESRDVWKQQMHSLRYGVGKAKDLLGLEQEFERLRIKLYPSSSQEGPLNVRLAEDYGQCILRGDPELYKEALRILTIQVDGTADPSLTQWKAAAAKAVHLREVTRSVGSHRGGTAPGGPPRWRQSNRYEQLATVNEMNSVGEVDSGEAGDAPLGQQPHTAAIHRLDSRPPRERLLTDEQEKKVKDGRLCWQCYQPGHRRGDDACKERGKPRRKPKAGELNA
jgi:hypothetical protein